MFVKHYVNNHGVDLINELKWQTRDQIRVSYLATLVDKCVHVTCTVL